MGIFQKFSTLLKSNINDLIARAENPEKMLNQIILDMRDQLAKAKREVAAAIADERKLRAQLDENKTLKENVAGGNDKVFECGAPKHIVGDLQEFLFSREHIMSQVKTLSGGERNRLLLAKLFSVPSNVLVLDEPTNDLDAETLELLEERLMQYSGTVLMVSHDW